MQHLWKVLPQEVLSHKVTHPSGAVPVTGDPQVSGTGKEIQLCCFPPQLSCYPTDGCGGGAAEWVSKDWHLPSTASLLFQTSKGLFWGKHRKEIQSFTILCAAYCVILSRLLCCLLSDSFDVLEGSDAVTEPEVPRFALDTCHWRSLKSNCRGFMWLFINAQQLPRYKAAHKASVRGPRAGTWFLCARDGQTADLNTAGQWGARGNWGFPFPKIYWSVWERECSEAAMGQTVGSTICSFFLTPRGFLIFTCSCFFLPAMLNVHCIQDSPKGSDPRVSSLNSS